GRPAGSLVPLLARRGCVTASRDATVIVWDPAPHDPITAPENLISPISAMVAMPDEKRVLTASDDGFVKVWDLEWGVMSLAIEPRHEDPVLAVARSHDGRFAVSGCLDGSVHLYDVDGKRIVRELHPNQGAVRALGITRAGQ